MPVDLYVGGAEHAVLHLLYARFWHKVLFDRGHVSGPEPFRRLVNQGMILGEMEFTGYRTPDGQWVSPANVARNAEGNLTDRESGQTVQEIIGAGRAGGEAGRFVCADRRSDGARREPCLQDVEEPRQRGESGRDRTGIWGGCAAAVRDVHGAFGGHQAVEHAGRAGCPRVPGPRLADDRGRSLRDHGTERGRPGCASRRTSRTESCTARSWRSRGTSSSCSSTRRSPA